MSTNRTLVHLFAGQAITGPEVLDLHLDLALLMLEPTEISVALDQGAEEIGNNALTERPCSAARTRAPRYTSSGTVTVMCRTATQ